MVSQPFKPKLPFLKDVNISHFPLMLFEISKLIKYDKKSKATGQSEALFQAALAAPTKSRSTCSAPLPSPSPLEKPWFINYKPFHFLQSF